MNNQTTAIILQQKRLRVIWVNSVMCAHVVLRLWERCFYCICSAIHDGGRQVSEWNDGAFIALSKNVGVTNFVVLWAAWNSIPPNCDLALGMSRNTSNRLQHQMSDGYECVCMCLFFYLSSCACMSDCLVSVCVCVVSGGECVYVCDHMAVSVYLSVCHLNTVPECAWENKRSLLQTMMHTNTILDCVHHIL